ncbi:MAG: GAF domain-containing protein, partial [Paucibacter sp.]|nr:GAF domain-containing protein [Roseateles sp.]
MIATNYGQRSVSSGLKAKSDPQAQQQQLAILSSHERCQMFGLLPQHRADMSCLSQSTLAETLQRNSRLCAQALPVMEMLYEQLTHAHSMVLLSDASGVVLHALGDPDFLERAQRVALAPGAVWSEAVKGTNAVGTALMTEEPTLVNGQDHYLREFHFLTCSAAPIFDHKGALLGVINVSGDRRSYHPHTLALASMAARMIETQWFNDLFRQSLRLHIHASAGNLGTLREGVLALDPMGRVVGVNRNAIDILGQTAAQLRRSAVATLFDADLNDLLARTRSHPGQPLQLSTAYMATRPKTPSYGVGQQLVAAHIEAGGVPPRQCLQAVLSLGQAGLPTGASASAAQAPMTASAHTDAALASAVAALDRVMALPAWQTEALRHAAPIAQHSFGPAGVFMGFDFHLGP